MQPFCPHSDWVWKHVGSSSIEFWQDDVVKVTVKVGLAPTHRPAFPPRLELIQRVERKSRYGAKTQSRERAEGDGVSTV